jgi:CRISPR/Cas system-associated exonuclease Cas4 (RecB family)
MSASALVMCSLTVFLLAVTLAYWGWRAGDRAERASRPRALIDAELLYAEKLFRVSEPVSLVAKIDRAYRTPSGLVVLVELKTRWADRTFASDVIQLSAQKLALEGQTRQVVARYGYVTVQAPTRPIVRRSHCVELLSRDDVVALIKRRDAILAGRIEPRYADFRSACRTCAYQVECAGVRATGWLR